MQTSIASGFQAISASPQRYRALAIVSCTLVALAAGGTARQAAYAAGPPLAIPAINNDSGSDPRAAQVALERANQLLRTGASAEAVTLIEQTLIKFPRDPQLRFLRAVIHVDAGEKEQAISMLERLTQDFPELPEPYNNLAVLHSQAGNYDLAKRALEDAVRALPGYPLAQQNLGDIYLQLAARAYESAARVTPASAGASTAAAPVAPGKTPNAAAVKRLELVRELIKRLEQ